MTSTIPATTELERKLDVLTDQVAMLAEEARLARRRRERFEELQHDLMPVATDALGIVGDRLEDLDVDVADIGALLTRLAQAAPLLERMLGQVEMYAALFGDVAPLGADAMKLATDRLAEFDERGYFTFAKGAARVADQVVTGFSEDDIAALGDNVVLILNTIKDLTQPEVMAGLHRMISAVRLQHEQVEAEPAEPPSLFSMIRQLRDPEIRRGIARGLNALRAVADAEPERISPNPTTKPSGGI